MKKLLSLFMAVVMLLSTVGSCSVVAYSATRVYAKDRLDEIQTISGYVPGKTAVVTGNCYAFVSKVCEKLYGVKYDGEGLYGNYKSHHYSGNYKTVATYTTSVNTPTSATIDNIKDFFVKNALPGDVIHFGTLTNSESNSSTHTVMVYSVSSTRLQIYHANYETVDYSSTDCHVDSLYWNSWKKNPTQNEYTSSGSMYSNNRLFYNKMKVNGVGISINRYVKYNDKFIPTNITKPTVSAKRVDSTSIKLSWDKIMSATRYRVQYKPADGDKYTTATSYAKDTSYTVTGLKTGTSYKFRVCARIDGEWREYSDEITKKALPPQLVKLNTYPKKTGLRLEWPAYSDLTGIVVYRSTKADGNFTKLKTITTKASTGTIDKTVKYGTKYYYKIMRYVVVDGKTHYSMSKPIAATYRLAKPKTQIYRESASSMQFKFIGDGAQTEFVYTIKDSKDNVIKKDTTTEKSIILTKLKLGETYTCNLYEKNDFGKSYYSSTSRQLLPPPSAVTSVSQTSSGILVNYTTADDVTGYYIYRSTESDGDYTRIGTVKSNSVSSYLDSNISLNTKYYYKVKQYVTKKGTTYVSSLSPRSSEGVELHLDSPTISVVRRTPTSVAISWNEVNKALSYIVYYKQGSGAWHATQPTTDTKINLTGLTTGKTYTIQVYARNRIGASDASTQKKIKVLPKQVTGVQIAQKKSGLKLTWTRQSGVSGYAVYRSTSKDGKYKRVATLTSYADNSYLDTSVNNGKRYYYRICSYKTVNSTKYYGTRSKAVSMECKM